MTLKPSVSITATWLARGIEMYRRRSRSDVTQSAPGPLSSTLAKVLVAPAIETTGSTTEIVESLFISTTK